MNFFEQQERARRNSTLLVVLLTLAVISLIALTSLAVAALFYFQDMGAAHAQAGSDSILAALLGALSVPMVVSIAIVVSGVVLVAAGLKSRQFAAGGRAVAEALGGRLINTDTRDADERQLLNIVEETALASGMPVPAVYLLDEPAINAFAAGHAPGDAVIGITRGAVEHLNRSELQGVVAHEFSHIFHGDMRLNLRLTALLHGILVIGLIGRFLLRSLSRRRVRVSSSSRNNQSLLVVLLLGVVLVVVGYAGTFFGNLIKAAVSRQREFLADAAAVQYTRDPQGIGGALRKIRSHAAGTRLSHENAAEFSHFYFGPGVRAGLSGLLATHPPLDERIRRVLPNWRGEKESPPAAAEQPATAALTPSPLTAGIGAEVAAARAEQSVGNPQPQHFAYARERLERIDRRLYEAAHHPAAARALVLGLVMSRDPTLRAAQFDCVKQHGSVEDVAQLQALDEPLRALAPEDRLPLLELALPALKQLSRPVYRAFHDALLAVIRADQRISLLEWALYRIVRHNVEPRPKIKQHRRLEDRRPQLEILLSVIAHAGHDTSASARAAVDAGAAELGLDTIQLLPKEDQPLRELEQAMARLVELKPLEKPLLLRALVRCIQHNGRVSPVEAELFRAVADVLDCPMPPLLADVRSASATAMETAG